MCPGPPSSTSSSCGNESGPRPGRTLRAGVAACLAALSLTAAAASTTTTRPLLLVTLDGPGGEREVEAHDLRFVYFTTRYRQRLASRDEGAAGERTDVVGDRKECQCLRMPDWSKLKMNHIRSIEITRAPGSRVAMVRVTRREGKVNEYPATSLYGGDGLYPPFFAMTIEGAHREFPLILAGRTDLQWPEENLVRILWTTTTPAPKARRPEH